MIDTTSRLEMFAGDTFTLDVAVTNDDATPIDLTGAVLFFSAKRRLSDISYIFQCSADNGITITDAPNGRATIEVVPNKTKTLIFPPSDDRIIAIYDLVMRDANGKVSTFARGSFVIFNDVTKAN